MERHKLQFKLRGEKLLFKLSSEGFLEGHEIVLEGFALEIQSGLGEQSSHD
jgi:hypothetical protein